MSGISNEQATSPVAANLSRSFCHFCQIAKWQKHEKLGKMRDYDDFGDILANGKMAKSPTDTFSYELDVDDHDFFMEDCRGLLPSFFSMTADNTKIIAIFVHHFILNYGHGR